MRFATACSGIGAPEVAWMALGWHSVFLSEIEPFARAVLAHHYPGVPLYGDFTALAAADCETVDILCAGTPCQSFSLAGRRGGLADARGNLALEYIRLAGRIRSRWVLWENVPGVLSSNRGRDFGAIVGALAQLGYGWAYRIFDAQYFGLAQSRKRLFLVGYLGDWRAAAAVLFEPESLCGDRAEGWQALGPLHPCLTAKGARAFDDRTGYVLESAGVRITTPREHERLLGFQDDYTLVPYRGKPATDSPRYRALGGSMAVPVIRWIGGRMATVDAAMQAPARISAA
jgi:DNA (cytosine-5)-methyltransferase 1